MPLTRHRELQMDESECFHLWLELGALSKVSKRLYNEGKYNHDTGKPFTPGGIRNSALRYIIYNPDDAFSKMVAIDPASPYLKDTDTWYRYLAHKAMEVFHNRTNDADIFGWAKQYEIPEKYVDEVLHD